MESTSESNRIQCSGHTANQLKKLGYKLTFRGLVTVKVTKHPLIMCCFFFQLYYFIYIVTSDAPYNRTQKFHSYSFFLLYTKQGKGEMETYWLEEGPGGAL